MTSKWQTLFEEVEIIDSGFDSEIWNIDKIYEFEKNTEITLPEDYKEFCQVFGTGKFGNYVNIYCPSVNISEIYLEAIKLDINAIKEDVNSYLFTKNYKKGDIEFDLIEELINSSFVFGDDAVSDVFFWDLRTFKSSDKSYDIYVANSDCCDGDIYKIGRDFYDFVYNFCLGMKCFEILPETMHPSHENIRYTFTPFNSTYLKSHIPRSLI